MYKTILTGIVAFLVLSFIVFAGCATNEREIPTTSAKEIKITVGTQEQLGKLAIAVSNIRRVY